MWVKFFSETCKPVTCMLKYHSWLSLLKYKMEMKKKILQKSIHLNIQYVLKYLFLTICVQKTGLSSKEKK